MITIPGSLQSRPCNVDTFLWTIVPTCELSKLLLSDVLQTLFSRWKPRRHRHRPEVTSHSALTSRHTSPEVQAPPSGGFRTTRHNRNNTTVSVTVLLGSTNDDENGQSINQSINQSIDQEIFRWPK